MSSKVAYKKRNYSGKVNRRRVAAQLKRFHGGENQSRFSSWRLSKPETNQTDTTRSIQESELVPCTSGSSKPNRPVTESEVCGPERYRYIRTYVKRTLALDKKEECYAGGTLGDEKDHLAIKADASHECSSRQSNTSTSQHAGAATKRTSCRATDDDGADDAELFSDHSDDGSMDCIKPSTKTETSTEIKTSSKTEMTTKTIAISAAEIAGDEVFSCDVCSGSIVGFRYVCVQCAHYDLCGSCEARGEHSLHYVLRIPRDKLTAEVATILSKIRTHLLYGLETEEAEQETDDRVVPTLPVEFEIKAEIKEDLPDPLEHEDVIQPDDHYTEPEYIVRESTSKEKTPTPAPVNTSSMILTETEGNYVNIENPVKSKATKIRPKTIKHKNTTEPEHNGSEKRMKIYLEEQTQASETLMDVPVLTAGPSTEGASGLLPDIVKTAEDDEDSFQVFSHSPHKILEDKPGPDTGMTKATSKKKEV